MSLFPLTLPLYVILFVIGNILNDDEFFADTVNTPKEIMEKSKG